MDKLVEVLTGFARQQVEAGADVIQIFDSWAGALSVEDLSRLLSAAHDQAGACGARDGVPVVIYFGVDTASLLPAMRETGADVIGLDWRTPLEEGWKAVVRVARCREIWIRLRCLRRKRCCAAAWLTCCGRQAEDRGTSSTWDTASCRGRRFENVMRVVEWVKELSRR